MKKAFALFCGLLFLACLEGLAFHSSLSGGAWTNPLTWDSAAYPGPGDDVFLHGEVYVGGNCFCANIWVQDAAAVLRNQDGVNGYLYVSGNISNSGTIRNAAGGGNFALLIGGDVSNNGSWSDYYILLNGNSPQTLSFPSSHPYNGANLWDNDAASPVLAGGDLWFNNTAISTGNATLRLDTGDYDLNLHNCVLTANVQSTAASVLNMTGGGYISGCGFQSISFAGEVNLGSDTAIAGDLVNTGILQNGSPSSRHLYVQGNLTNLGTLQNGSAYLYLHCAQDLVNSGALAPHQIYLSGPNPQYLASTGSLSPSGLSDTDPASPVVVQSDCQFINCSISLNNGTLILNQGAGRTLGLSGGSLQLANVQGGNGAKLALSNGAYLFQVACDEIVWEGSVIVADGVSAGNLTNNGVLMNYGGPYGQTLSVSGQLVNGPAASIVNNGSFNLNLGGDLYDYGAISNTRMEFTGESDHLLWQDAGAAPISCWYFQKTTAAGSLIMLSDLRLQNCQLTLNGSSLALQNHTLQLNGGSLAGGNLVSGENSILLLSNNATLSALSGGNLTFQGTVLLSGDCSFATVVNQGFLSRYQFNTNLTLSGDFLNHGTVTSDYYGLFIYVAGNFANYGSMSNKRVILNGIQNQTVHLTGEETIQNLVLESDIGSADWYLNGIPSGLSGNSVFFTLPSLFLYGIWQPYLAASNSWGRQIYIIRLGELDAPQNPVLFSDPAGFKLRWNQVSGAFFYKVYAAWQIAGNYSPISGNVIDPNPVDGIVEFIIPAQGDKRFFRITAGY